MEEHRSIIGKLPDTIEEPEIRYNHKVSHNSYSAIPIKILLVNRGLFAMFSIFHSNYKQISFAIW